MSSSIGHNSHQSAVQLSYLENCSRPVRGIATIEKLPTNVTSNKHAIHRWFNFVAGFAPEFVSLHCPSGTGSLILDPFAGCGTTLVEAQTLGHRAIGFEPHPFFARIARAKIGSRPTTSRLDLIETTLLSGLQSPLSYSILAPAAETFLLKLFQHVTLERLLGAREAVMAGDLATDDLTFLVLSRVVELCSTAKIDGIYKAPTSTKTATAPETAVRDVIFEIRCDVERLTRLRDIEPARLYSTSSEDMKLVETGSVDVAITSPPYLNNFDFAEMTRMHLYFWGLCGSWREITEKVRSKLVVNTTTALTGHRDKQSSYRREVSSTLLPELDSLVNNLSAERRLRAGKKDYNLLVFPYFAQMTRILRETLRCLRNGGRAHVVVADAAFYGIHVSTPQLLAAIMSDLGYKDVSCAKLRDRGQRWILKKRDGSPTGLGEYHISGARGH